MKSTDTARTATEQMLLSDSIDRTVEKIDFYPLAGRTVYLNDEYLDKVVDRDYLVSTLRQRIIGCGCSIAQTRDQADYIVEARSGAVGTNRQELLFGIPAITLPSVSLFAAVPTSIPELPVIKSSNRSGVTKLAVFAYHRETGAPVWQSGIIIDRSTSKDTWVLGAGPFQRGSVHEGPKFAGERLQNPLFNKPNPSLHHLQRVPLREEMVFQTPALTNEPELLEEKPSKVIQAKAEEGK